MKTIFIWALLPFLGHSQIKDFSSSHCEPINVKDCNSWLNTGSKISWFDYKVAKRDGGIRNLDFQKNLSCIVDGEIGSQLETYQYHEIKSAFRNSGVYVYVLFKYKQYRMRFAPEYRESVVMNINDFPFLRDMSEASSNTQNIQKSPSVRVFLNKILEFDNIRYNVPITVSKSCNENILGLGFIKGFDWIIDFKKKKVYARKNDLGLETTGYVAD